MANRTIYVSDKDEPLFEQAKELAGQALSSVIVQALREFVSRQQSKQQGLKEISVNVGLGDVQQVKKFVGVAVGEWSGFSDDRQWYLHAVIYHTQKEQWAVLVATICKASLFLNKKAWTENGDYLSNPRKRDLYVGGNPTDLQAILPEELYQTLTAYAKKQQRPVEYLDI